MLDKTKKIIAGTAITITLVGSAFALRTDDIKPDGRVLKEKYSKAEWAELKNQALALVDKESLTLNEVMLIEDVINTECEEIRGQNINGKIDITKAKIKDFIRGNCEF